MRTISVDVLSAITNIVKFKVTDLSAYNTTYQIGINAEGERLEYYIKDALANTFNIPGKTKKDNKHSQEFSWLGNQNNPPDIIIRNSDAYEIKKTTTPSPQIELNSSPPKAVLHADDSRLLPDCRKIDGGNWDHKDIYYVMGHVKKNTIHHLSFIHGKCFAANSNVYSRLAETISTAVEKADLEFNETNELGRVNRVDPLGITNLRIRGMWNIQHPRKVFDYIHKPLKKQFGIMALILKEKYNSYNQNSRISLENNAEISVRNVKIKDPNNPANRLEAVLITYPKQRTLDA